MEKQEYLRKIKLLMAENNCDEAILSALDGYREFKDCCFLNEISDIYGLTSLRNLTTLNLSYNQISDVTALYALTNLRELYLTGNPVSEQDIRSLNTALPYCYIVY